MKKSEIQQFFTERMAEITHKDTIDSYRVRSTNAFILLKECLEVIEGWKNANVKMFETVQLCIEELLISIDKDVCLTYCCCTKDILIEDLRTYSKDGKNKLELAERMSFLLNLLIQENEEKYLCTLFDKLSSILVGSPDEVEEDRFMPILEELDSYITAFVSQLIYKGFSKVYLYQRIRRVMNDSSHSYESRIEYLRKRLCRKDPYKATVIFKIDVTNKSKWVQEILSFQDVIPENLLNESIITNNKNFVSPTRSSKYYIFECESAWDSVSAIKKAREALSLKLDSLHLALNSLNIEIPNKALVISKNGDDLHWDFSTEYVLDGGYELDERYARELLDNIECIINNSSINIDVKERLVSALRHLRIGNSQNELEQRFVNYWIALEFIFSSPVVAGSTFVRLKSNLTNLLTACYMKRNILSLSKTLIKAGTLRRDAKLWLLTKEEFDRLVESQTSILLQYRLLKMKSKIYEASDKRKEYILTHEKNVDYHIARIYRLRNELIHEAALKQDIENVTSNLRYYLVFLLSQMINYYVNICDKNENSDMDHFFYTYEIQKRKICRRYDLTEIMNVPLDMRLE